jgi:hypothetical protein
MAGDHLFLSSAPPDWALAEWLALRLTTEGYRVWCRRFPLIGGERYPRDPNEAIARETFRLIALVSRASSSHAGAIRELELGLRIGRERKEEFVISLAADDLSPGDVPPALRDLALASFSRSWAAGMAELLAVLRAIAAPCPLLEGERIAREARAFMTARRSWHTVL